VQAGLVADVEYLSSFPYREAFSTNFNQAVSSDVVSTIYATREQDGMAFSAGRRPVPGREARASNHARPGVVRPKSRCTSSTRPALEFTTTDHRLGSTGLSGTWTVP
jgi:LPS-assembly protein